MHNIGDLFSLKGRTAIVTGAAQGIGRVVSDYLALAGANIAVVDINPDKGREASEQIAEKSGVKTVFIQCNVTKPDEVDKMVEVCSDSIGTADILFNNAGICLHKPALDVTYDEWAKIIDVNLNGVFLVSRAFAKKLIAEGKKGSIINTASMSGTIINVPQHQASYNASKAACVHLTKSLAVEWAPYGIRVNAISPGYICTEMTQLVREDWRQFWIDSIPFKRMGTPEELAGAVIYLASDASTYTSGCNLLIDGCFTCI